MRAYHSGEVKDNLENTLVMDEQGDVQDYNVADFNYAYRNSTLKRFQPLQAAFKPVVLSVNFRLTPGDPTEINRQAERFLAHRRQTQPVEPSLGSAFVNPPGDYAGRLIEAAGLKGMRIGGAEVSQLHANFIINPKGIGAASALDVIRLTQIHPSNNRRTLWCKIRHTKCSWSVNGTTLRQSDPVESETQA